MEWTYWDQQIKNLWVLDKEMMYKEIDHIDHLFVTRMENSKSKTVTCVELTDLRDELHGEIRDYVPCSVFNRLNDIYSKRDYVSVGKGKFRLKGKSKEKTNVNYVTVLNKLSNIFTNNYDGVSFNYINRKKNQHIIFTVIKSVFTLEQIKEYTDKFTDEQMKLVEQLYSDHSCLLVV